MKLYHLNLKNSFKEEPRDVKNSRMDLSVDDSCSKFADWIEHTLLCFVKYTFSLSAIFCNKIIYKLSLYVRSFVSALIYKTYIINFLFIRFNVFRIIIAFKSF